jgi:hypothetical protein
MYNQIFDNSINLTVGLCNSADDVDITGDSDIE